LPIQSLRIDTLGKDANPIVRYWDTLYYDNGKPYKIQSRLEKENFETQFYHKDGSLAKTVPPDSLKLKVYKDNIDCYYGLVNKRGDTIVKARFDHINSIGYKEEAFWRAYLGESLTLFDLSAHEFAFFQYP
jgi:hypothetical protein